MRRGQSTVKGDADDTALFERVTREIPMYNLENKVPMVVEDHRDAAL